MLSRTVACRHTDCRENYVAKQVSCWQGRIFPVALLLLGAKKWAQFIDRETFTEKLEVSGILHIQNSKTNLHRLDENHEQEFHSRHPFGSSERRCEKCGMIFMARRDHSSPSELLHRAVFIDLFTSINA